MESDEDLKYHLRHCTSDFLSDYFDLLLDTDFYKSSAMPRTFCQEVTNKLSVIQPGKGGELGDSCQIFICVTISQEIDTTVEFYLAQCEEDVMSKVLSNELHGDYDEIFEYTFSAEVPVKKLEDCDRSEIRRLYDNFLEQVPNMCDQKFMEFSVLIESFDPPSHTVESVPPRAPVQVKSARK